MFRPNVAIFRFTSESMVVLLLLYSNTTILSDVNLMMATLGRNM